MAGYAAEQRYVDDTNVLETTFTTSLGVLRVTDAMQMDDRRDAPFRTVLRRVECLAGTVEVAWSVAPRFGYGRVAPDVEPTADGAVLAGAGQVARVHVFGLGVPVADPEGLHGRAELQAGDRALLALVVG